MDKRLKKEKRQVKGSQVTHVIPKYIDFSTFDQSVTGGGTFYLLSVIPQGSGTSQRVANTIRMRRLYLNLSIYLTNTDIVTTSRVILFRWIENTASATPTVGAILENPSSTQVFSHFDFENQQNYEVIWDKVFHQSGGATTPSSTSNMGFFNLSIPLKKNPCVNYNAGATTGTNTLYMLTISDSSLTPFPLISFNLRVYYDDIVDDPSVVMIK